MNVNKPELKFQISSQIRGYSVKNEDNYQEYVVCAVLEPKDASPLPTDINIPLCKLSTVVSAIGSWSVLWIVRI